MLRLGSTSGFAVFLGLSACQLVTDFSHSSAAGGGGNAGDSGSLGGSVSENATFAKGGKNSNAGLGGGSVMNGGATVERTGGFGGFSTSVDGSTLASTGGTSSGGGMSTTGGTLTTVETGGASNGNSTATGGSTERACTGTQQVCSMVCIDVQTNKANCGKCGRSCLGGECSNGACQPAIVVPAEYNQPIPISLDEKYIYYEENGSGYSTSFYRTNKNGLAGNGELLASDQITSFALTNEKLFWVSGRTLTWSGQNEYPIRACSPDSCSSTNAVWKTTSAQVVSSTTITTKHILTVDWGCSANWCVTWWGTDGSLFASYTDYFKGTVDDVVTYTNPSAYGENVYWIQRVSDSSGTLTSSELFSSSATAPSRAKLANLSNSLYVLSVTEKSVLLRDSGTLQVFRVPLPLGLGNNSPIATGFTAVTATEDATAIYWIDASGTFSTCQVANCAGSTRILAVGQSDASGLIQDSFALYWGRSTPGQLMRLAK